MLTLLEVFCFSAGLNVGHKFFSRAEMVSIGLHSHSLKGIDFVDKVTEKVSDGSKFKPRVSLNDHVVDVRPGYLASQEHITYDLHQWKSICWSPSKKYTYI